MNKELLGIWITAQIAANGLAIMYFLVNKILDRLM
jgi:hypothetical protein